MAAKKGGGQKERRSTFEIIHEEVKSLSETYVRLIESLDSKAATLFGFSIIAIGICASLFPYMISKTRLEMGIFFLIGIGFIGISAISSFSAYRIRAVCVGVRLPGLSKKLKKIGYIDRERLSTTLIKNYLICISHNKKVVKIKRIWIKASFLAAGLAILILIISVIIMILLEYYSIT